MRISKFQFNLPQNLIANSPAEPRDNSRLLVLDRETGDIEHKHFYDIADYLDKNDVLVMNNTKVFPARLIGNKDTGGKIELLLLENVDKKKNTWKAMYKGNLRSNNSLYFNSLNATVVENDNGTALVQFDKEMDNFHNILNKEGTTPLPPYIENSDDEKSLRNKYQTVYAKEKGSAAAPTAGFHFTNELIEKLKNKGVQIEHVTLHVGLGTFAPVKTNRLEDHKMHKEYFELNNDTANKLNTAKQERKRIIAVGTTTVRVLESATNVDGMITPDKAHTDIFIYPPYNFKYTDALITNFHLPKSTLLALVTAFVSRPNTKNEFEDFNSSLAGEAYRNAIEMKYRFYSFGDAMLLI